MCECTYVHLPQPDSLPPSSPKNHPSHRAVKAASQARLELGSPHRSVLGRVVAQAPGTGPMPPPCTPLNAKSRQLSLPSGNRQRDANSPDRSGASEALAGQGCHFLSWALWLQAQETPEAMWKADCAAQLLSPSRCSLHISFPLLIQSHLTLSPGPSQTPWSTERPH